MIDVLVLCLLVLLVVAVIGLFAMMGELSARVPGGAGTADVVTIWPADSFRSGPLARWPPALDQVMSAQGAGGAVVAVSTSCSTCRTVLDGDPRHFTDGLPLAVVVVAPDADSGRDFVEEFPVLARVPVHVDLGGEWLHDEVGLDSSPAVFTVRDGAVRDVFNFNSSSALVGLATASTEETRHS